MPQYRIADLTVEMTPGVITSSRATDYAVLGEALPELVIPPVLTEGAQTPMQAALVDYSETARYFYTHLTEFDGFLLHAAAVAYDGRA